MRTIRHAPDCEAEDVHEVTGKLGDLLARCRGCGAFAVLTTAGTTSPQHARPIGRYVCREHHAHAVTWRGTGCEPCAAARRELRDHRRRRRAAALTDELTSGDLT